MITHRTVLFRMSGIPKNHGEGTYFKLDHGLIADLKDSTQVIIFKTD